MSDALENFRDVGGYVNLIADRELLPLRRIYRCGKLDWVQSAEEIGRPGTIINLRIDHDARNFGAHLLHFPCDNKLEKYHTETPKVKRWLVQILRVFANEQLAYPVLIHCVAGKDRTGIVIAALLHVLGIEDEVIVQEYLLSDGKVEEPLIRTALRGFRSDARYFQDLDLGKIRENVRGSQ